MTTATTQRIFLLSPASCGGERAAMLLREAATFDLAARVRTPRGATIGEVFSFLSGLYFRGKLAYAQAFEAPPPRMRGTLVITTNRGLIPTDTHVTADDLRAMGCQPIDNDDPGYQLPLSRSVAALAKKIAGRDCDVVLLGIIATGKYVDTLHRHLGDLLKFPQEFVGRGDMSRGGLLLRCVREDRQLTYVPIVGSTRHGTRPAKLERIPGILKHAPAPALGARALQRPCETANRARREAPRSCSREPDDYHARPCQRPAPEISPSASAAAGPTGRRKT